MEEEGPTNRGGEVYVQMNDVETEPLLSMTQTYSNLHLRREPLRTSRCTAFVKAVFKVCFCVVGLWGHHAWSYTPRVFFSAICIYQVVFELSFLTGICPDFECDAMNNSEDDEVKRPDDKHHHQTAEICAALFSVAAAMSYLVFISCVMLAKRKDSALAIHSQSVMKHVHSTEVHLLFVAFVFYMISTSVAWHHIVQFMSGIVSTVGLTAAFLAHWTSVNTCNVFAVSSFALGTSAQDALKLIRNIQNGTLDDVLRIHEDLCTVVFSTVSAYSVWFVLHWFTYGASVIAFVMYISEEIAMKAPLMELVYLGCVLVCLLYLFLIPCMCAARITSHCAAIYEEINCTTSAYWSEGHPFKDRQNVALFISYAKERQCGFKIGRMTFNTSLAWFSFFFGLAALLYHF